MPMLELTGLDKRYDAPAVSDVHLTLEKGKTLSLLGPSGCGKTTLLRLVAGLEPPDHGRVVLDGEDVTDLQPHKRRIGMMFQEFALFPHKSVFENVAFGLQMQPVSRGAVARRTAEMLSLVRLARFSERLVRLEVVDRGVAVNPDANAIALDAYPHREPLAVTGSRLVHIANAVKTAGLLELAILI